ncbi:hypothetical protein K437DRAFT_255934 [Tilletiaria anomala UBC 951]|uniref:Conserved oligomeric Golgi complex subunit 7 n=1 Tax=Tilletiaria anomala (strain ATCC 24038 / CBS 436.72 / UBC 951) TaxID=1037660 RepID=A0A066W3L0_TILAU|nr:uncharacterized protein K437DRAFT_255934 [Tilletiaria anomala UBC 951]KDN47143.1 hypothetical protein K437DRAFT_255934 [Tilletiaria anomala UBC 951]
MSGPGHSPQTQQTPQEYLTNLQRKGSLGVASQEHSPELKLSSADELENELLERLEESTSSIDWLNETLSNPHKDADASRDHAKPFAEAMQSLERDLQRVSNFVVRSSSESQRQTDATMKRLQLSVPQLKFDLKLFKESTLVLKTSAQLLQERSRIPAVSGTDSLEKPETTSLERLSRLTLLKERMSAARDVLRDAESWSTLGADVTAYLGEDKIAEASLRLAEALSSLAVFERTEVYEQRRALMDSLTARLEDAVTGRLQEAVEARDLKTCSKLEEILSCVNRGHIFERCWTQTRRRTVFAEWKSVRLLGSGESTPDAASLADYLPRFHQLVQNLLNEERIYAPTLFPKDPSAHITRFLSACMQELEPSMAQRLGEMVIDKGELALESLMRCWETTQSFALATQRLVAKVKPAADNTGEIKAGESRVTPPIPMQSPTATAKKLAPEPVVLPSNANWDIALFEPFLDFQCNFRQLCNRQMMAKWKKEAEAWSSLRDAKSPEIDSAELIQLGSSSFELVEETLEVCMSFTKGFATSLLLEAADDVVAAVLASFDERARLSNSTIGIEQGILEKDVKYAARKLDACRQLFVKLQETEQKVAEVTSLTAQYLENDADEARSRLLQRSTLGSLKLLEQSALKSASLSRTLERLTLIVLQGPARSLFSNELVSLPNARQKLLQLVKTTQLGIQNIILQPLVAQILVYAYLPSWTARNLPGADNEYDLHMPTFSLSPTETMASLCEGLLDLPRLFEVYAQDEALAFCVHALPFLEVPKAEGQLPQQQAGGSPATPLPPTTPMGARRSSFHPGAPSPSAERRASFHGRRYSHVAVPRISDGPEQMPPITTSPTPARRPSAFDTAEGEDTAKLSAGETLSYWLRSLILTLITRMTTEALPSLPRLSPAGAKQLATDLEYLCSILDVLNVDPNDGGLLSWKQAASLSDEDGKALAAKTSAGAGAKTTTEAAVDRSLRDSRPFAIMAKLRGFGRVI